MIIDYHMLSELLTPSFLRKDRWMALMRTLFVGQIQRLHTVWFIWSTEARYKASITPQTISLEHMIERNLDCRIRIEELDGNPYDFLVNIEGNPDMAKLSQLLNTYKLAGKSYVFELTGSVNYSCFFFNHIQEDIIEKYSCVFIGHVQEDDRRVLIQVYLFKEYVVEAPEWNVIARASKKVKSSISIDGTVLKKEGSISLVDYFHVTIAADTIEGKDRMHKASDGGRLYLKINNTSVTSDEFYDYEVENLTAE